jgi:hypothetical protein
MVSVNASIECNSSGIESGSGQTKGHKIGICCFSNKHEALRSKSKDWLTQNQDDVLKWSDMSTV